jgi:hypothetical protein
MKKQQVALVGDSNQKLWRSSGLVFVFGVIVPCEENHASFSSADFPRSND